MTIDKAWQFYMSTVPPDDRYDSPSGDFCSGYVQGGADAEAALAECEREKERLQEEQNKWINRANRMCLERNDLLRKLAAAREALREYTPSFVANERRRFSNDFDVDAGRYEHSLKAIEQALTALTEAGEGEK